MVLDEFFSVETYQAVLDFQKAVGLEQDGILNIGEVAFLPGSLQVKNQLESSGGFVGPGSDILEVSLSEKMVRMNLPASDQGILSVGDSVLIEMPDNSEVPGTVEFVSQTAQAGLNEWDPKTFEVQIEFDDPSVAEGLDEAPVDVIVVSDSVEDVMAVPISALLALLEGGYAVELDTGGGNIVLIGVEVGFFGSNGLIQVISDQLQPGDRVIVP
jgi:peptidoglycan hydrolase-like protein with peptidoglycan-binding domain